MNGSYPRGEQRKGFLSFYGIKPEWLLDYIKNSSCACNWVARRKEKGE